MSLDLSAARAGDWFLSLAFQGIDLTTNAHLKVKHEAIEFAEEPSLEEAADVFIAILGAIHQRGWTPWQLAEAVEEKLTINERRTWHKQPDGTYQHS